MNKIILGIAALLIFSGVMASAQEQAKQIEGTPTVVFGAAATPDGGQDMFVVEQPKDSANPLGDPIVVEPEKNNQPSRPQNCPPCDNGQAAQKTEPAVTQPQSNNPAVNAENLGKDFQNTLMEANGRIYDVQSFPEQDLKVIGNPSDPQTIYSPNVNN